MNTKKNLMMVTLSLATFAVASASETAKPASNAEASMDLKSIGWDNAMYYNPRVNFGDGDKVPFHDDATATQFCKSVKERHYVKGVSKINFANPQDGMRYKWDGTHWVEVKGGDYPRVYICLENPNAGY